MRFIDVKNDQPLKLRSFLKKGRRLIAVCKKYGVELLFLHGSLAQDRHGRLSDIDLALLGKGMNFKRLLKIEEEFSEIIGREDIDIADLNRASSLLGMQVIKKGIPLYVSNQKRLKEFRYRTFLGYLDSSYLRSCYARYTTGALL